MGFPCSFSVQEKLDSLATTTAGSGGGGGNNPSSGISGVGGRIFNIDSVESSGGGGGGDVTGSASKNFKFGGSAGGVPSIGSSTPNVSSQSAAQASSKVKASHKLKAQTSRIVSSFKQQSVVCSIVREFNGHKVRETFFCFFSLWQ